MLDVEAFSKKEIWQAKKLLYESDGNTKKSFIFNLAALTLLLMLLFFSVMGSDDKWTCEIESSNNRGHYICVEMRRQMNCKTISGPIRSEIFLKVKKDVQASAIIECPWEIAISEIRLCFILLGIISSLTGIYALKKTNKKYAELSFQLGLAFAVLLVFILINKLISAYFDYVSIRTSQINNYNLCNLQEEFQIEDKMKGQMQCSFTFFDTTVLLELGAAIALVIIQTKFRLQVPFTLINGGNNKLQKLVINCELPYFIQQYMEIAYISVNSLSFVSCSLLGVLGFVSPVYKSYPTKIQVWIAWNLIFQSIAGYFDIGKSNSSNLELGLATYLCAEAFYGLMIIFLYELWATLTSPFLSTKSKGFFYSLVICVIFGGWATTIYYREQFSDSPTLGSSLLENMFSKALALWLFFALRIYILLKETQNQQDQEVYNFKSQYFKRQMIWFLFLCVIELIAALIKEKQVALLMLYCIGFQFAFFQLLHKFPLLKLKVLFFQSCCTPEQINTIVQIENGTYSSDDYILTVDALKNAQIVELVKAILLSVNECLQLQFLYNSGLNPIKRVFKFELDLYSMKSSKLGQNNQTRVLLKTYYPDGFKDLMRRDGYDKEVIGETLNLENNLQAFKKTKESMGKSGAFFFFSQNSKLILKTLTKQELKSFLHRIEYYFIHLRNYPQSLLAKIYGLYKVKLVSFYDTYLVLMENSFEQLNQLGGPQRVYDLKGSITNRTSKTTESVKKDNNFLKSLDMPIKLFDCSPLRTQIEMDSNFLLSIGYMDYSLLIGIRNRQDEQINETLPRLLSGDNCVYSFSIIDYLQEFDCNKKMEFSYKSLKGKKAELSCIEPIAYNARFKQFCKTIIVELDQQ